MPARSPDLSSLDFILCHIKNTLYATQPASSKELRERIAFECPQTSSEILQNMSDNDFYLVELFKKQIFEELR